MKKFQTGDVFSFELPEGGHLSGRIMLDVNRQCIRPKRVKADSTLGFFNRALLVEVYRQNTASPGKERAETLIPGVFVDQRALERGRWEIVGHENVDPTKVEFPEALVTEGPRPQFIWGELALALNITYQDVMRIEVYSAIKPSVLLNEIAAYYLRRATSPNEPELPPGNIISLASSDLRFSAHRDYVYQSLKRDLHQSYFEAALQAGYDLRRFYQ
jgi:hypothetical protein